MKWFKNLNRLMKILVIVATVVILFVGSAVVAGVYEAITMSDGDRAELLAKQKEEKESEKLAEDEAKVALEKEEKEKAEQEEKKKLEAEEAEQAEVEKEAKEKEKEEAARIEKEKQEEEERMKAEAVEKEKAEKAAEEKEKLKTEEETKKEEPVKQVDSSWDDLKEKDKIVGISDKDYAKISKQKPGDVRNDSTGKWKISKIADNINIEEYALSYSDLNMKDDEVHFVVNFNYNTTTVINKMMGLVYVDVKEYVKKEEHDAKKLGSGMLLKSYVIYPDGDIQVLE